MLPRTEERLRLEIQLVLPAEMKGSPLEICLEFFSFPGVASPHTPALPPALGFGCLLARSGSFAAWLVIAYRSRIGLRVNKDS